MINRLRPPVVLALALLLATIFIPACRNGSEQPDSSVPYFSVLTVSTVTINGVPNDPYPNATTYTASLLNEISGAVGLRTVASIITNYAGRGAANNVRLPGVWQFTNSNVYSPCFNKKARFVRPDNPFLTNDFVTVHDRDLVTINCIYEQQILRLSETVDENGNIVPLSCCATDTLYGGQALQMNQSIRSGSGEFLLVYRGDGALDVINGSNDTTWTSNTYGATVGQATMQTDGNLVVYDAGGTPVWHAGTYGNPGAYVTMQNDGNLVVYSASGNALWSSMFGLVGGGGGGGGSPTGRWKDDGHGGCYWDPNDSGPNQCVPPQVHH